MLQRLLSFKCRTAASSHHANSLPTRFSFSLRIHAAIQPWGKKSSSPSASTRPRQRKRNGFLNQWLSVCRVLVVGGSRTMVGRTSACSKGHSSTLSSWYPGVFTRLVRSEGFGSGRYRIWLVTCVHKTNLEQASCSLSIVGAFHGALARSLDERHCLFSK